MAIDSSVRWARLFSGYADFLRSAAVAFGGKISFLRRFEVKGGAASSPWLIWYLEHLLPHRTFEVDSGIQVYGDLRFVGENLDASPSVYLSQRVFGRWRGIAVVMP